jgi:aerotolerance regulator-like protein
MPSPAAFGLLYPGALYFFAIVPALVIAYLARERPRRVTVSSVLAFRALHVMRGERFGGRPRFNWTFFVELAILCLAVLAMARPYLVRKGNPVGVVIDNSALMQVLTANGRSRFDMAVAKVKDALEGASGSGEITVYATAPQPHLVGSFASVGAATSAIERVRVTDAPDDPAALNALLAQLNSNSRVSRVIVASYRGFAAPVPARVTPITVGEPVANYAIGSFALSRETFGAAALHGRVSVANFSPIAQTLKATITGDGKAAGSAEAKVGPGEVATLDFPRLAPAEVYRVQLEPADAFALDNVAYATGAAVKAFSILFVSPTPGDAAGLTSIPGVAVTVRTPAGYSPQDLANSDLAIFEYTAPKELPTVNALLVMPPPGDPVFDFAVAPTARLALTAWPATDALTDGVNFRLLNLRSGEYLAQHPWMSAVVSGADGGLMIAGDRQGHRFVATGFNPFPYLGRQNLPMSILTLNMLSYLAGFGAQSAGFRTGERWLLPAGVTGVVTPSGRKESVQSGSFFTSVISQGIYMLVGSGGKQTPRAVNLADLSASDLENAPPIKLEATGDSAQAPNVRTPLAPYALAAIIALIMLEAMLVYRRRAPAEA